MDSPHISICICTFKRPQLLGSLLERLKNQRSEGTFRFSIVVADNDREESARSVVENFCANSEVRATYCAEPRQNIALARNKSVECAAGDYIAFIDDDEFPDDTWLLNLLNAYRNYNADGVLGPVKPYFESAPPRWLTKGKFFDRPTHPSGYKMNWTEARTGNVLFRKDIVKTVEVPFRSQFDTAGEDVDFFRRMMDQGFKFVWCDEAPVYELVPASRCTRSYLLRRALLRGSNFHKHPADKLKNTVKSLIAAPCYLVVLPFLLLLGQHVFLKYLIKFLDHSSRLLAFLGLSLVTQRQT